MKCCTAASWSGEAGVVARKASSRGGRRAGRQAQAFHVAFAIAGLLDGIDLAKVLDREVRLERQQLVEIGLGFVTPSEMAERGDKWLVSSDDIGIGFNHAAAGEHRSFIVAF